MSNPMVGRRRVDRILDPEFTANLSTLSNDDLLERRDEALQEESDVSYVRRLIQGRLDLLRFEEQRRAGEEGAPSLSEAADDDALVAALAGVLTDKKAGGSRESQSPGIRAVPLHSTREPSVSVYARRTAESAVADVRFSDLRSLTSVELAEACEKFSGLEQDVSRTRTRLQAVADQLAGEAERRVAEGSLEPERM